MQSKISESMAKTIKKFNLFEILEFAFSIKYQGH
jgi:hypothetical protein